MMGGDLVSLFEQMAVAEEEIEQAKARWPEHSERLHACFTLLQPSALLRGKDLDVYRHHCRELLERVARGADTRPGTIAEVLCGLMGAATRAPLTTDAGGFAEVLFQQVMPGRLAAGHVAEQWAGQHAEILHEARHKLAVPDRA